MPLRNSASIILGVILFLLSGCQTRNSPTGIEPSDSGAAPAVIINPASVTTDVTANADENSANFDAQLAAAPIPPAEADNSIWPSLREAMSLTHALQQKRVQQEIKWLRSNPRYLERLQPRLQKYLPYLLKRTVERGLPAELALIPIVESALDPYAFSPGGAGGLWQFMRPTALQYGLTIDRWYDGRRDIVAATEAALDYLEALNSRLQHWPLAIAAYNGGGARVRRAVKQAGSTDFFELKLPRETQYYLPKVLALAALIAAPDTYSVSLPNVSKEQSFGTLALPSQFDIQIVSTLTGLTVAELRAWNPAFKRWATAAIAPHHLIVPVQKPGHLNTWLDIERLQKIVQSTPSDQRMHWKEIVVRDGDSLSVIAQRHNTDIAALRVANNLRGSMIRTGAALLVPIHQSAQSAVSHQYDNAIPYTVKPGDSLWSIAKAHNVSIATLVKTNQIAPNDVLRSGRMLKIPTAKLLIPPVMPDAAEVTRKIAYTVRKGDSLARIAKRFAVGVNDLARWNRLDLKKYLQPGQRLTVYIDAVNT